MGTLQSSLPVIPPEANGVWMACYLEAPRHTLQLIESSSVWQDIGSILFEELQQGVCLSVAFRMMRHFSRFFFRTAGLKLYGKIAQMCIPQSK